MRFEILERDGLARVGDLEIDGVHHETPAVAYASTALSEPREGALRLSKLSRLAKGALVVDDSYFSKDPSVDPKSHLSPGFRGSPYAEDQPEREIAVLSEVSEMLLDSRKFVDGIASMKVGRNLLKPLFCSTAGLPHRLALLAYCGVDVVDSVPLIMASHNGLYLTDTGVLDYRKLKSLPCECKACSSGVRGREELLRHNYAAAERELRLIKHAISEGRLRELVETRVRADPWLVQDLRLLDIEQYALQELHAPVKGAPFHAGSKESLSRPEIIRWRRRLEERYHRPTQARVLLLIPCSAKKPYSTSQSHRHLMEALQQSGRAESVHEVIVTSPLGIVPRELELFYPAQDYDIPVTGHWDRDEVRLVQESVTWLVESQKYDLVISHLGSEREAVNAVLTDFVDTSQGQPGSRSSLERLTTTIIENIPEPDPDAARDRDLGNMRSIAEYQFGWAGTKLVENASVVGRWPNLKIVRSGEQLGMLTGDRGMISLTLKGGSVMARAGAYRVEIEDFTPKGNLFAVGVQRADPQIRIGDDVVITFGEGVRAVGVARMSAQEMEMAERGEAVHIRHAAK